MRGQLVVLLRRFAKRRVDGEFDARLSQEAFPSFGSGRSVLCTTTPDSHTRVLVCLLRAEHLLFPAPERSVMHHHDHAPHPHLQHCIDTCAACAQICDRCADDMIGMDGGDDRELRELCIRLCRDCADLCALSVRWMSRLSPATELLCRTCSDICDRCASVCEQHSSHHPLCGDCAVECRRCAAACRDMATAAA